MTERPQAHSVPLSPVARAMPVRRCSSASGSSSQGQTKNQPGYQEHMRKIIYDLKTQFTTKTTHSETAILKEEPNDLNINEDEQCIFESDTPSIVTGGDSPRLVSPVNVNALTDGEDGIDSSMFEPMESYSDIIKPHQPDGGLEVKEECLDMHAAPLPIPERILIPVHSKRTRHPSAKVIESSSSEIPVSIPKAKRVSKVSNKKVNGKLLASILKDIPSIGIPPSNRRKQLTGGVTRRSVRKRTHVRSEKASYKRVTEYHRALANWEIDIARGSKARCAPVLYALKHLAKELKRIDGPWMTKAKLIWTSWKHRATPIQKTEFVTKAKQNRAKYNTIPAKPEPSVKEAKSPKTPPTTTRTTPTANKPVTNKAPPTTTEGRPTNKIVKVRKFKSPIANGKATTSKAVISDVPLVSVLSPPVAKPSCSVVTVCSQRPLPSVNPVTATQRSFPTVKKMAVQKKNALSSEIMLPQSSPAFTIPYLLPPFDKGPDISRTAAEKPTTLNRGMVRPKTLKKEPERPRTLDYVNASKSATWRASPAGRYNDWSTAMVARIRSASLSSSGKSFSPSPSLTPNDFSLSPQPSTPHIPKPPTPLMSPLATSAMIAEPPTISGNRPRTPTSMDRAVMENVRQLRLSSMSLWELKQLYNRHKIELFKRRSVVKMIKAHILKVEQEESKSQLSPTDLHKRFLHFLVAPKERTVTNELQPFGRNCTLDCFDPKYDTPVLKPEFDIYNSFTALRDKKSNGK